MINNTRKIVKKATHFWKHGKHKGSIELQIKTNREIKSRQERRNRLSDMKSSIKELFKKDK